MANHAQGSEKRPIPTGSEELINGPETHAFHRDAVATKKAADLETNSIYEGSVQEVWWDHPLNEDSSYPRNWTKQKKWKNIGILSFITFLTPLASAMFAPGVPLLMEDFRSSSSTLATFVVSVFVLGFAFGPLVMAPLSELYGRTIVYHLANAFFLIFTILCAISKSMTMLIVFRFFAGFSGVAVVTCGGGSISDMMIPQERGSAMAVWSIGPILGPVLGPVAGGFLVDGAGWRWVFWLLAIMSGVVTVVAVWALDETYEPTLLKRKANKLQKATGREHRSRLASQSTSSELFKQNINQPIRMFFQSAVVFMMSLYTAATYGILYLLFTTFTFVFKDIYGFSASKSGLAFLGSGVGTLTGLLVVGIASDRNLKKVAAAGRMIKPEDRLPLKLTLPASLCLPIGLLIYGWTADKRVHWMGPQIGNAIIGFGMMSIVMCIQTYLVDAFTSRAASAIAANAVLRSLLGALLPLCGLQLYDALGLGWGNSLLALLTLVLAPVPWCFGHYGERLRLNSRLEKDHSGH